MRKNQIFQNLALGLAVVVLLAIRLGSHVAIGDDAYMTFKNALNLMRGNEFSFNVGERVYATSTPLYAMLLALVGLVSGKEPIQTFLPLGIILDLANLFLLNRILTRAQGTTAAALGTLFFAFSWTWATATLIGMETPFFLFLLLATSYSVMSPAKQATKLGALCAGLSIITRPEGIILAGAFFLYLLRRDKKIPRAETLIIAAIGFAWGIFALNYFHVLLPHSIKAKSLGYHRLTGEAFGKMIGHLSGVFLVFRQGLPRVATAILGGLLMVGWIITAARAVKRNDVTAPLHLFGLIVFVGYTIANPFIFNWYLVPLEPTYIVALLSAAAGAPLMRYALTTLALILPLQFVSLEKPPRFALVQADCPLESVIPKCLEDSRDREDLYLKLAEKLAPQINEHTVILAPEFGAFGYYSNAYLISSLGHISPQVMQYLPPHPEELQFNNCIPLRMIQGVTPDYIFALNIFFAKDVLGDKWFNEHYQLIDSHPTTIWQSKALLVFKRKT